MWKKKRWRAIERFLRHSAKSKQDIKCLFLSVSRKYARNEGLFSAQQFLLQIVVFYFKFDFYYDSLILRP